MFYMFSQETVSMGFGMFFGSIATSLVALSLTKGLGAMEELERRDAPQSRSSA